MDLNGGVSGAIYQHDVVSRPKPMRFSDAAIHIRAAYRPSWLDPASELRHEWLLKVRFPRYGGSDELNRLIMAAIESGQVIVVVDQQEHIWDSPMYGKAYADFSNSSAHSNDEIGFSFRGCGNLIPLKTNKLF